tara:strand:- start:1317 stop:2000 length:684 start_codon:yes stop_codon:yes gene_type:complete
MKIYCVRIGDKYGQQYEDYMNEKLADYEVIWIKEPIKPNVPLQWNKMVAMNDDSDEPVVVLDIDKIFINDYKEALDYSIKPGEFLAAPYWWGNGRIPMSGGFYKFYPKDCKYIYNNYINNIDYYTNYYIKNGYTTGPVNGEFLYVHYMLQRELKLITLPDAWVTRWTSEEFDLSGEHRSDLKHRYRTATGNYLYKDEFNPMIKIVHFTNSLNKPHEWKKYDEYLRSN